MKAIALLVYTVLQIVCLPLAVIGIALTGYKQIAVSKRLGVSQTAIEVINGRWTMHIFGIRKDPATAALISVLPNTSVAGLWLVLFPLWLRTQLSGELSFYPRVPKNGDERIADLVPARTLYFDRIIERTLKDVEQMVLMGAGYDTRPYGVFADADVTFFELDQSSVQAHKRDRLSHAGLRCEHVTFVELDFSKDDLFEALLAADFDPCKKTLFLWEGVTLYLSRNQVQQTMTLIKNRSAPGSVLLADIYSERMLDTLGRTSTARKVLELTDEGLAFGLPFAANWKQVLEDFANDQSMSVGEAQFLGHNDERGPYAVVAELLC